MIRSVESEIKKSHEAYPMNQREMWVLEWAGQVVLCVSMVYWTAEVHNCLLEGSQRLPEHFEHQEVNHIFT